MTFNYSTAKDKFLILSHEDKVIKLMKMLEMLKDSSFLFWDLYKVVSVKDFLMEENDIIIYYDVIMVYANTMDALRDKISNTQRENMHDKEQRTLQQDQIDIENLLAII